MIASRLIYWGITVLSRLRKLVFRMRRQLPAARLADSLRRVNRLARLMTVMQQRPRRKAAAKSKEGQRQEPALRDL